MRAKYTTCRFRFQNYPILFMTSDCMDRPFELPPLTECVGEYYESAPCSAGLAMPYYRKILGECFGASDLSDWSWHEYREIIDQEGNLLYTMDDEARFQMVKVLHGIIIYKDP